MTSRGFTGFVLFVQPALTGDADHLAQVRTYTRRNAESVSDLKIQIVETNFLPIAPILNGFYSTHVVNLITWCSAFAIFPIPTFVQHKCHMLKSLSDQCLHPILRKWAKRGWDFDQTLWDEEEPRASSIQRRRRVGDRYTWRMSLDTSNLPCSQMWIPQDYGIQNNVFEMEKMGASNARRDNLPTVPHYRTQIRCSEFRSPVLRHTYVVTPSWMEFIGRRLDRATYMEFLTKLEPSDWAKIDRERGLIERTMQQIEPRSLHELGSRKDNKYFDRPSNWRYYDEDMKSWYDAWNEQESQREKDARVGGHLIPHPMD